MSNKNGRWPYSLLNEMRMQSDPFADEAAAALFRSIEGKGPDEVRQFIKEFVSHDFGTKWDHHLSSIPPPTELIEYFNDFSTFSFSGEEKMILQKGSDFFLDHGPAATLALGVRSLLKQYAHTDAIQVLRMTTLLEQHTHRRIIETMQFLLDVMQPGWHRTDQMGLLTTLNAQHVGVLAIQKLRLVHAMVRHRIKNKMYDPELGDWNLEWGNPINQEDMVFATQTFSLEVLEGLMAIGHNLSEQEIETYFSCWKIIGRALGVDPRLEPINYADGWSLQQKIYSRHFTLPNEYGPVLSEALINWLDRIIPLATRKTIITLIKAFNGKENFEILQRHLGIDLGIADRSLHHHISQELDLKVTQEPQPEGLTAESLVVESFFKYFMESLLAAERGGKNAHFRIGDGFQASWNINRDLDTPPSTWEMIKASIRAFINSILDILLRLLKKK